jgi:hypothetical protein
MTSRGQACNTLERKKERGVYNHLHSNNHKNKLQKMDLKDDLSNPFLILYYLSIMIAHFLTLSSQVENSCSEWAGNWK